MSEYQEFTGKTVEEALRNAPESFGVGGLDDLDFEILTNTPPAFANVTRGDLRLLLSGPTSSAGRPMPDGAKPGPGGWNRLHFVVDDIDAEVARLRERGARFRNDVIEGPGGKQILVLDPSGNVVELFEPRRAN